MYTSVMIGATAPNIATKKMPMTNDVIARPFSLDSPL